MNKQIVRDIVKEGLSEAFRLGRSSYNATTSAHEYLLEMLIVTVDDLLNRELGEEIGIKND